MKLLRWEQLSTEETLARLKETRLKGFDQARVYETATLKLAERVDTDRLVPAQRYVLKEDLTSVRTLAALFAEHGIDIFALTGALLFWIERDGQEEGPIPLLPPVVEESAPDGGIWLINDGMHRITAARDAGKPINIILAEGVPAEWPYYAEPLPQGWAEVEELDVIPDGYKKKAYRNPENYKDLFRNFNGVFDGIQKQRKKTHQV